MSDSFSVPEPLRRMLQRYTIKSVSDYQHAIKEVVQEIALLGLWRAKFFEKAAFYGGTALRILHELDRFSEDLDFTLLKPDSTFDLAHYEKAVQQELKAWGFSVEVRKKQKTKKSAVDSAFIKLKTLEHFFLIEAPSIKKKGIHPEEIIKIRFEIDTDPPSYLAETKNYMLLLPSPFSVKTLRLEDLFAGKVHAALCREWKGRVKGRDWYDLVWFVSRRIPLNLTYLQKRMEQSGFYNTKILTKEKLIEMFDQKIKHLDIQSAKEDVFPFIDDSSKLALWSPEFFQEIARKIEIETS